MLRVLCNDCREGCIMIWRGEGSKVIGIWAQLREMRGSGIV